MEAMEAVIQGLAQRVAAIELNENQQQQQQAQVARAPDVRDDNIAQDDGDEAQMKIGRNALRGLPRYDRKTPWRTFIQEFRA